MRGKLRDAIGGVRAAGARALGSPSIRFLLAGALNTAFGLAIYPVLLWTVPALRTHYLVALGLAQVLSVAFAYGNYKLAVFRTRANVVREFGLFGSYYLAISGVNWLALPMLVEVLRLPPIVAQVGFTLIVTVASFFWHSKVTFRPRDPGAR